jgi:hypothetical protein
MASSVPGMPCWARHGLAGAIVVCVALCVLLVGPRAEMTKISASTGGFLALTISVGANGEFVSTPVDGGRLQYTTLGEDGSRCIMAELSAGFVPAGTRLTLTASAPPIGCGVAGDPVTLSNSEPGPLILAIPPACNTGFGINDGPQLVYAFEIMNVAHLVATSTSLSVVRFTVVPDGS